MARSSQEIAASALEGAIRAETDVGPMLLHGHDTVITPAVRDTGTWEPHLRDAVRAELRPGMVAADVGANIGYFARVLSEGVGPRGMVYAIEPDPANLALLRENAADPPGAPINVVAAAAWDRPGGLTLTRCEDNTGDHRIAVRSEEREVIEVPAVVLDELLADGVDLLLLDTQGVEHVVLRGAREVLARHAPVIFVEFWPEGLREAGTDPLGVLREYRDAGFGIRLLEGAGPALALSASPEELLAATLAIEPERFGTLRLEPPRPAGAEDVGRRPWWRFGR